MIVREGGSVLRLIVWQWKFVLLSFVSATLVTVGYMHFDFHWLRLPAMPLAVVGAALGIFVSFRTNSCYQRWWEARKLWGRLINTSRHLSVQALHYIGDDKKAERTRILRRHIAYVHTLRCLLREQAPLDDEVVPAYLQPQERAAYRGSSNMTARLLDAQMADLVALNTVGAIDDFRLQGFDQSVRQLLDIQGGCERIKKTPLPRAYGFISERMIQTFSVLFPCALVAELGWATIGISMLVAFCFKLISETGRVLDDPFTMFWNGLPLMALSRTIEVNLLELMGEADLPPMIQPTKYGVLM